MIIPITIQLKPVYKNFLAFGEALTHSLVIMPLIIAVTTQAVLKIAYPTVLPDAPNLYAAKANRADAA